MKNLFLFMAFGLIGLSIALAQSTVHISVVSKEDKILDGNTEIELSYNFSDSTSLSSNPEITLKMGWSKLY